MSVDLVVSPRGGNPLHIHPHQEEYFKAVSGTVGVQVGDKRDDEGNRPRGHAVVGISVLVQAGATPE